MSIPLINSQHLYKIRVGGTIWSAMWEETLNLRHDCEKSYPPFRGNVHAEKIYPNPTGLHILNLA